jgi:hypothetical protein
MKNLNDFHLLDEKKPNGKREAIGAKPLSDP